MSSDCFYKLLWAMIAYINYYEQWLLIWAVIAYRNYYEQWLLIEIIMCSDCL